MSHSRCVTLRLATFIDDAASLQVARSLGSKVGLARPPVASNLRASCAQAAMTGPVVGVLLDNPVRHAVLVRDQDDELVERGVVGWCVIGRCAGC
jgi:hypothetical protein